MITMMDSSIDGHHQHHHQQQNHSPATSSESTSAVSLSTTTSVPSEFAPQQTTASSSAAFPMDPQASGELVDAALICVKCHNSRSTKRYQCSHCVCDTCYRTGDSGFSGLLCPQCRSSTQMGSVTEIATPPAPLATPPTHLHHIATRPPPADNSCGIKCLCKDNSMAFYYCYQCDDFLCTQCRDAHARVRLSQDHCIDEISSAMTPPPLSSGMCQTHRGEVLSIFCNRCRILTCKICMATKHRDHEIARTDVKSVDTQKDLLRVMANHVPQKTAAIRYVCDEISTRLRSMDGVRMETRNNVTKMVKLISVAMRKRVVELFNEIDQRCDRERQTCTEILTKAREWLFVSSYVRRIISQESQSFEPPQHSPSTSATSSSPNEQGSLLHLLNFAFEKLEYVNDSAAQFNLSSADLKRPIFTLALMADDLINQVQKLGQFVDIQPLSIPQQQQQQQQQRQTPISHVVTSLPMTPTFSSMATSGGGGISAHSQTHQLRFPMPQINPNLRQPSPAPAFVGQQYHHPQHQQQQQAPRMNDPYWSPSFSGYQMAPAGFRIAPTQQQHQYYQNYHQQQQHQQQQRNVAYYQQATANCGQSSTPSAAFHQMRHPRLLAPAHAYHHPHQQLPIQTAGVDPRRITTPIASIQMQLQQHQQHLVDDGQYRINPNVMNLCNTPTPPANGFVAISPAPGTIAPIGTPSFAPSNGTERASTAPSASPTLNLQSAAANRLILKFKSLDSRRIQSGYAPTSPGHKQRTVRELLQARSAAMGAKRAPATSGGERRTRLSKTPTETMGTRTQEKVHSRRRTKSMNGSKKQRKQTTVEFVYPTATAVISSSSVGSVVNDVASLGQGTSGGDGLENGELVHSSPGIPISQLLTIRVSTNETQETRDGAISEDSAAQSLLNSDTISPNDDQRLVIDETTDEADDSGVEHAITVEAMESMDSENCLSPSSIEMDHEIVVISDDEPSSREEESKNNNNVLIAIVRSPQSISEITTIVLDDLCCVCNMDDDRAMRRCTSSRCGRLFHGNHHVPSFEIGKDADPEGETKVKWTCTFCVDLELMKTLPPQDGLSPYEQKACERVLLELYTCPNSEMFHAPATNMIAAATSKEKSETTEAQGPLDFSIVQQRLAENRYSKVEQFLRDVNQVFVGFMAFYKDAIFESESIASVAESYYGLVETYFPQFKIDRSLTSDQNDGPIAMEHS